MNSVESMAAIEKFTKLMRHAAQAGSRDIRLPIADATALLAEITNLAALVVQQQQQQQSKSDKLVGMDGGRF